MSIGLEEGMPTWQNHGNRESGLAVAENLSERLIGVTEASEHREDQVDVIF